MEPTLQQVVASVHMLFPEAPTAQWQHAGWMCRGRGVGELSVTSGLSRRDHGASTECLGHPFQSRDSETGFFSPGYKGYSKSFY